MRPRLVRYLAEGWGIGELWLEADQLVWHELPRPRAEAPLDSHPLAELFGAYFAGERISFDGVLLALEWCTPFQRDLVEALRRVRFGETVTYGELAALAGRPNAHRAAGTFCAQNRFPLVLPCHRVVAANSSGSYGSLGVAYKRRLLALEGVTL